MSHSKHGKTLSQSLPVDMENLNDIIGVIFKFFQLLGTDLNQSSIQL